MVFPRGFNGLYNGLYTGSNGHYGFPRWFATCAKKRPQNAPRIGGGGANSYTATGMMITHPFLVVRSTRLNHGHTVQLRSYMSPACAHRQYVYIYIHAQEKEL